MAEEHGTQPIEGDVSEEVLNHGVGRKVFGVTLPPWRSPLAQGSWGKFDIAEELGELT